MRPSRSRERPGLFRSASPKASPMRPVRSPKISLMSLTIGERRARNIPVLKKANRIRNESSEIKS